MQNEVRSYVMAEAFFYTEKLRYVGAEFLQRCKKPLCKFHRIKYRFR